MTAAATHNGGKTQCNFGSIQTGGDYMFLNAMKGAQAWSWSDNNNSPVTPDVLDSDGYLTSLVHLGVHTVFYVERQQDRPGNYVITWDGNGTVSVNMNNTLVSGSKTSSTGSGRYVFSTTDFRFDIGISAVGSPRITNMKVYHINDETNILAGNVFGTRFKAKLAEANFGVYRFLNTLPMNTTNITTWATRKPASYFAYATYELRAAMYAGGTSLSHLAYTASAPSGWTGIADKATVHVLFQQSYLPTTVTFTNASPNVAMSSHNLLVNDRVYFSKSSGGVFPTNFAGLIYYVESVVDANTITLKATIGGAAIVAGSAGSPSLFLNPILTLNVASSGDIDIHDEYSNNLNNSTSNSYPVAGTYQALATLVYDANLNSWIKQGADLASGSVGIKNGAPPELLVQLCAEMGAHPYFAAPPLACTPMTDWHTQLATYIRDNGPSWMIPRFEGPNELWNGFANFFQTAYATNVAIAYGWGADYHNWYGRAISTIGQAVSAVYSNNRTKYQVLVGVQTSLGTNAGGTSAFDPRLSSAKYVLQTPQSGYTATAASGWVTHVCCAQYFAGWDNAKAIETTKANAFAGKSFDASITGTVMTVTGINASNSAPIAIGDTIFGTSTFTAGGGVPAGVTITSFSTGTAVQTITAISQASPGVVSITNPPVDGTKVYIKGAVAGGMTQLTDGWYTARNPVAGTSYQLRNFANDTFINTTAYNAYTSGATSQSIGDFNISVSATVTTRDMTAAADLTAPATYADTSGKAICTISNASPAVVTITNSFGSGNNEPVIFSVSAGGALPTGLTAGTTYYVSATGLSTASFSVSATSGGTRVNTSSAGSGTFYVTGANSFCVPRCALLYANWKTWAQGFGIQKMCGYEGGYSVDFTSGGNSLVDMLRGASKYVVLSPFNANGTGGYLTQTFNDFVGLTGGGFTAEFPSSYLFSNNPNLFGYTGDGWSIMEDIWQTPNTTQFEANRIFNATGAVTTRQFSIRTA